MAKSCTINRVEPLSVEPLNGLQGTTFEGKIFKPKLPKLQRRTLLNRVPDDHEHAQANKFKSVVEFKNMVA